MHTNCFNKLMGLIFIIIITMSQIAFAQSDFLEQPIEDCFEDIDIIRNNWGFGTSSLTSNPIAYNPNEDVGIITRTENDNTFLVTKSTTTANGAAIYKFPKVVEKNVSLGFHAKFGDKQNALQYYTLCGSKNGVANMELFQLWFRSDGTKGYIAINHSWGVGEGKNIMTIDNVDPDKWYDIQLILNLELKKISIMIDGGKIGDYDFLNAAKDCNQVSRFAIVVLKDINFTKECFIDNFKLKIYEPLKFISSNPAHNESNVSCDKKTIEIEFNHELKQETISEESFKLINMADKSQLPVKVTNNGGIYSLNLLSELKPLNSYQLIISGTLSDADDFLLGENKEIIFTTALKDLIKISNIKFIRKNDIIMVTGDMTNDTEKELPVASICVNLNQLQFEQYQCNNIILSSKETKGFEFQVDSLSENQTIELFFWDSLESQNAYNAGLKLNAQGNLISFYNTVTDAVEEVRCNVNYTTGIIDIEGISCLIPNLYKTCKVMNEKNEIIFLGQNQTDSNCKYSFSFMPSNNISTGNYFISLRETNSEELINSQIEIQSEKFEFGINGAVSIEGDVTDCGEVEAIYDFFHILNAKEGNSIFQWYQSKSIDGEFSKIENANAKKYKTGQQDAYHYIMVKVTPVSLFGTTKGVQVQSQPVLITSKPIAKQVKIKGDATVGKVLNGEYEYYHVHNNPEEGSLYKWSISDSYDGTYFEVGNGIKYVPKEEDQNQYIRFEVTPVSNVIPFEGQSVCSMPIQIKACRPSVSGGGSSSSVYVPKPVEKPNLEVPVNKVEFNDIHDHWAKNEIIFMAEREIVKGYNNGSFQPNSSVTRAEFITMISRMLKLEEAVYKQSFEDVFESDWYANNIQAALNLNIISNDVNFRPNSAITREEITKIAANIYQANNTRKEQFNKTTFLDSDEISEWAKEAVYHMTQVGIIKGFDDGTFKPYDTTCRAEAVTILYRLFEILQ